MEKINWKDKEQVKKYRKKWRQENKEELKIYAEEYHRRNPEIRKKVWDKHMYGGNAQAVLERDNFECQDCGMTQEQHIIVFGNRLNIHHKDITGKSTKKPFKNNDMDNLRTLCIRCHTTEHNRLNTERRWGELAEQDDSEYRFPKIRELVNKRAEELGGIQKGKKAVAKEKRVSFWTIDTKYYERKKCVIRGKDDE